MSDMFRAGVVAVVAKIIIFNVTRSNLVIRLTRTNFIFWLITQKLKKIFIIFFYNYVH
jgi:hypothetical protein